MKFILLLIFYSIYFPRPVDTQTTNSTIPTSLKQVALHYLEFVGEQMRKIWHRYPNSKDKLLMKIKNLYQVELNWTSSVIDNYSLLEQVCKEFEAPFRIKWLSKGFKGLRKTEKTQVSGLKINGLGRAVGMASGHSKVIEIKENAERKIQIKTQSTRFEDQVASRTRMPAKDSHSGTEPSRIQISGSRTSGHQTTSSRQDLSAGSKVPQAKAPIRHPILGLYMPDVPNFPKSGRSRRAATDQDKVQNRNMRNTIDNNSASRDPVTSDGGDKTKESNVILGCQMVWNLRNLPI